MDKLVEKIKVWHLIVVLLLQLIGFVFTVGTKAQELESIGNMAIENQHSIENIKSRLFDIRLLNERMSSLDQKMTELSGQIKNLNHSILELYKERGK